MTQATVWNGKGGDWHHMHKKWSTPAKSNLHLAPPQPAPNFYHNTITSSCKSAPFSPYVASNNLRAVSTAKLEGPTYLGTEV